jgi:hypothetical protein
MEHTQSVSQDMFWCWLISGACNDPAHFSIDDIIEVDHTMIIGEQPRVIVVLINYSWNHMY